MSKIEFVTEIGLWLNSNFSVIFWRGYLWKKDKIFCQSNGDRLLTTHHRPFVIIFERFTVFENIVTGH